MERINSLIHNLTADRRVKRIRYEPYDLDFAKKVFYGIAKRIIGQVEMTDQISDIWENLIRYVHADKACKYDVEKTILLMGQTGSGKTITMRILGEYSKIDNVKFYRNGKLVNFNFHIMPAREIVNEFASYGYDGIAKYLVYSNICIDDLGAEPEESVYYGTRLNVIQEIIETRYSKGLTTHFTTNFNAGAIAERYGDRVYSRIYDQCNLVKMNDKDFRINC
jgi:DNA replication protein DnaC